MDGISNHQLEIEAMTEIELQRAHHKLLVHNLALEFYPGIMEIPSWIEMEELLEEMQIRRLAE